MHFIFVGCKKYESTLLMCDCNSWFSLTRRRPKVDNCGSMNHNILNNSYAIIHFCKESSPIELVIIGSSLHLFSHVYKIYVTDYTIKNDITLITCCCCCCLRPSKPHHRASIYPRSCYHYFYFFFWSTASECPVTLCTWTPCATGCFFL